MIDRNQHNPFKKRHYIAALKWTVDRCLALFGYKNKPYLLETRLKNGEMMEFLDFKPHYVILYDYGNFRRTFSDKDYETQLCYAVSIAAHEMRHYYQVRQLYAKVPRETPETVEAWRKNHVDPDMTEPEDGLLDFYRQPMELDAALFSYVFTADACDALVSFDYVDRRFIDELEQAYVARFGETDPQLFPHGEDGGATE